MERERGGKQQARREERGAQEQQGEKQRGERTVDRAVAMWFGRWGAFCRLRCARWEKLVECGAADCVAVDGVANSLAVWRSLLQQRAEHQGGDNNGKQELPHHGRGEAEPGPQSHTALLHYQHVLTITQPQSLVNPVFG